MPVETCDVIGCFKAWEWEVGGAQVCDDHGYATHYRRWHCKFCMIKTTSRAEAIRPGDHHRTVCRRYVTADAGTDDESGGSSEQRQRSEAGTGSADAGTERESVEEETY